MIAFLKKIRLFIFLSFFFSQTYTLSGAPKKIAPQKNSSRAEASSKEKKNIFQRMSKYPKTLAAGSIGTLSGVALIIYLCLRDSNPPAAPRQQPSEEPSAPVECHLVPEPPLAQAPVARREALIGAAARLRPSEEPSAPVVERAAPEPPLAQAPVARRARGAEALASPVLPAPVAREEDPNKTVNDTILELRSILACKPNCDFMEKPYLVAKDLRAQISPSQTLLHKDTCYCFALANAIITKQEPRGDYPDLRRNSKVMILAAKIFTFVPDEFVGKFYEMPPLIQSITEGSESNRPYAQEIMNQLNSQNVCFFSQHQSATVSLTYEDYLLGLESDEHQFLGNLKKISSDQDGPSVLQEIKAAETDDAKKEILRRQPAFKTRMKKI